VETLLEELPGDAGADLFREAEQLAVGNLQRRPVPVPEAAEVVLRRALKARLECGEQWRRVERFRHARSLQRGPLA
jgi:hypothetical protein